MHCNIFVSNYQASSFGFANSLPSPTKTLIIMVELWSGPVQYRQRPGSLSLTKKCVVYTSDDGRISMSLPWREMGKIKANNSATSPNALLRLSTTTTKTLPDDTSFDSSRDYIFKFPDRLQMGQAHTVMFLMTRNNANKKQTRS